MAKIVGLVQVKGGVGRSTIATNLAGDLAKRHKVTLIDCDMPQGTSASWVALRQEAGLLGNLTGDTANNHRELIAKIEHYQDKVDYIVLDAPPRIAELARAILVLSDLSLIPIGASAAEVWATADILKMIEEAGKVRSLNVRLLWTRFRPYTRLAQELSEQASKVIDLPILKNHLGFRVAYAEGLGKGMTASELTDLNARNEVTSLTREIEKILR